MNKTLKVVLIVIVAVIVVFGGLFSWVWGQRTTAISLENKIDAQYAANQSEYDNMWKKFKELAQVPEMQAEQFKEVYTELISGRYEDQDLLFKMVQEQNPQLGTEVYTQLQREISAGRDTFNNSQKKLLDIIREYNTYVETNILMMTVFNKQPIDENDYIVTSERTANAFSTGGDDEIKLND